MIEVDSVRAAFPAVRLHRLIDGLTPLRQALIGHPLYSRLVRHPALAAFMQHHVFAVWDFMSLLKTLQQVVCRDDSPWIPRWSGRSVRLVNAIVLAEESDLGRNGEIQSHFELYLAAMREYRVNTASIDTLCTLIRQGVGWREAIHECGAPPGARDFMLVTFEIIESGQPPAIVAAFALGREDLLPELFAEIVRGLDQTAGGGLSGLLHYLERHIELDGDEHRHQALQLLQEIVGNDEPSWEQAAWGARKALHARLRLWDSILEAIDSPNSA